MQTLKVVGTALALAFDTLDTIAASKKAGTISAVTINAEKTDLTVGKVVGSVTVKNRSRRPFTMEVKGDGVEVKFLGVTKKLAA